LPVHVRVRNRQAAVVKIRQVGGSMKSVKEPEPGKSDGVLNGLARVAVRRVRSKELMRHVQAIEEQGNFNRDQFLAEVETLLGRKRKQ